MNNDIIKRLSQRNSICRGCGSNLDRGTEIVYTYSNVGRGMNIIFCIDCAKIIGKLANAQD